MRRSYGLAIFAFAAAISGSAHATTAEEVANGFLKAMSSWCVLSVAYDIPLNQWRPEELAGLTVTTDEKVRRFMQAEPEDTVWDVSPGKGAIFLLQKPSGDCQIMGRGPPVQLTMDATAAWLKRAPFGLTDLSSPLPPPAEGVDIWLTGRMKTTTITVELRGIEAGTPGEHDMKYSMIAGFVSKDRPVSQPTPSGTP